MQNQRQLDRSLNEGSVYLVSLLVESALIINPGGVAIRS